MVTVNAKMNRLALTRGASALTLGLALILTGCPGGGGDLGLLNLTVTPTSKELPLGTSVQLLATGEYDDGAREDVTPLLIWSSSDDDVAFVSMEPGSEGRVTALGIGTATITARTLESGTTATATIEVTAAVFESIQVAPQSVSLPKGLTTEYIVSAVYSDGSHGDVTSEADFQSDSPGVAAFADPSAPHRISGISEGVAHVTVSYGGQSASAVVEVTAAVLSRVSVQAPTTALLPAQSVPLRAFAHLSDGSTNEITQAANWGSSDPASISVSNDAMSHGVATASSKLAVPQPSITITAEWNGHSGTIDLTKGCLASADKFGGGRGTAGDPYRICERAHLEQMASEADVEDSVEWDDYQSHFLLVADVDFEGTSFYIRHFHGVFDGNGYILRGIILTQAGDSATLGPTGIFGVLTGTVKGLHIRASSVHATGHAEHVGGIAGILQYGSIVDSSFSGTVSVEVGADQSPDFPVAVGGIVGSILDAPWTTNDGVVERCAVAGTLVSTGSPHSLMGGIAGRNEGRISNSYAIPSISGSAGGEKRGGIVGANHAQIDHVYFSGTLPGGGGGPIGYSQHDGARTESALWIEDTVGISGSSGSAYVQRLGGSHSGYLMSLSSDIACSTPDYNDFMDIPTGPTSIWELHHGLTPPTLRGQPDLEMPSQVYRCE